MKIGVLLMTYGSATTYENVRPFMEHVYQKAGLTQRSNDKCAGTVAEELVLDFENRYKLIGKSPLIEITIKQAELLEKSLNSKNSKDEYFVKAAMHHSKPFIDDAFKEMVDLDVDKIVGLILAPQFSTFILKGYFNAIKQACKNYNFDESNVKIIEEWPAQIDFIKLLTEKVKTGLSELSIKHNLKVEEIPVIFTTHSLPKRVVDGDPNYLNQLKQTTNAILANLKDYNVMHFSGYQSAGHSPEEWLKPDLVDILSELKNDEKKVVLIVPIQFLSDHLEILYDLDIAAKAQCDEYGIEYNRITMPNLDPLLIAAFKDLVLNS